MPRTLSLVRKEKVSGSASPLASNAELATLMEGTHDPMWSVGPDHRLIAFNKAASSYIEETFGISAISGALAYNPLRSEQAFVWRDRYARALAEGTYRAEQLMLDGRWFEFQLNRVVLDGRTTGVSVFSKDVSRRKHAQDGLVASEARLREAERIGLSGSSGWDADNDITTWSEGMYRITGRDAKLPAPTHAERARIYTPESWAAPGCSSAALPGQRTTLRSGIADRARRMASCAGRVREAKRSRMKRVACAAYSERCRIRPRKKRQRLTSATARSGIAPPLSRLRWGWCTRGLMVVFCAAIRASPRSLGTLPRNCRA